MQSSISDGRTKTSLLPDRLRSGYTTVFQHRWQLIHGDFSSENGRERCQTHLACANLLERLNHSKITQRLTNFGDEIGASQKSCN